MNLTCTLGHQHTSDLEVKWNCSSCSFVSSLKPPHSSSLSIPEVKLKDSGKWTCELWKNGKKLTSARLSLKIGKRSERKKEGKSDTCEINKVCNTSAVHKMFHRESSSGHLALCCHQQWSRGLHLAPCDRHYMHSQTQTG